MRAKTIGLFVAYLPGWRLRLCLYRLMGVKISAHDNFISRECYLDPEFPELITIESGAKLGPRVIILCHNSNSDLLEPVTLSANCWIGAGAIICPGVTVGAGAVVSAGAVVLRNVKPGVIVMGPLSRQVSMQSDE
jgi:heptaprenylglycerol acetyltransferase